MDAAAYDCDVGQPECFCSCVTGASDSAIALQGLALRQCRPGVWSRRPGMLVMSYGRGHAFGEQDDGLGVGLAELAQRPVNVRLVPRERRGLVGELHDNHTLVLPPTLQRLDVVAADEVATAEGGDRGRRRIHVPMHCFR